MAFYLTVTFSGIMSFAEHPEEEGLRLLIPSTLMGGYDAANRFEPDNDADDKAIDGTSLARHYPRLNAGLDDRETRLRYLRNEEVVFDLVFEDSEHTLHFDLENVAALSDIWGRNALDPQALQAPATSPLVGCHVDLRLGTVATLDPENEKWSVPGTLRGKGAGGDDIVGCFATSVVWTVAGLKHAAVRTESYDGTHSERWDLTPPLDGSVALSIVNHCTRPWEPLPAPRPQREKDDDYRWHYHLLSPEDRTRMQEALSKSGADLPILFPVDEPCESEGAGAFPLQSFFFSPRVDASGALVFRSPPRGNCVLARWF